MLRAVVAPAVLALLAFGCSTPVSTRPRVEHAQAEHARPEPDPSCRARVQEPLAANGLEHVTVKVSVDRHGKLTLLEFLSPDVTPAGQLELRRAYEQCIWTPAFVGGATVDSSAEITFPRSR